MKALVVLIVISTALIQAQANPGFYFTTGTSTEIQDNILSKRINAEGITLPVKLVRESIDKKGRVVERCIYTGTGVVREKHSYGLVGFSTIIPETLFPPTEKELVLRELSKDLVDRVEKNLPELIDEKGNIKFNNLLQRIPQIKTYVDYYSASLSALCSGSRDQMPDYPRSQ